MKISSNRWSKKSLNIFIVLSLCFALAACGVQVDSKSETIIFADGTWDSVQFHNRVAMFIAEHGYGYSTEAMPANTHAILSGIRTGDIDVYMEMWIENVQEIYDEMIANGDILNLALNFDAPYQGYYVPTYVIEGDPSRGIEPMAPDLKSVFDLPKYWELFMDPENRNKGRLYGGIAGWEVDGTLSIKHETYGLNETFTYFSPGSETALNASLISAYEKGEPWVGYNWEPTWIMSKYDMTLLEEPEYTEEGWADGFGVAFPANTVAVTVNSGMVEKAPEVTDFLSNYETSSDLTGEALLYMMENDASVEETAEWFLREHEALWTAWVPADVADKVKEALK